MCHWLCPAQFFMYSYVPCSDKRLDANVGKLIAQGRAAKGWSQKDLATVSTDDFFWLMLIIFVSLLFVIRSKFCCGIVTLAL